MNKTHIKRCLRKALTLMELVIAMAMIGIIFAAILPQFALIRNSWDVKQGTAEALQNGRVLMDHINRNLSKAVRITAVSAYSDTEGHIEYEDNDGNIMKYAYVASGNRYVKFGPQPGTLSDLAGPVSSLTFTCYDACDLAHLLSPVTDTNDIRVIKVDATFTNSGSLGRDKTFTTWIYLRTNANFGNWCAYNDCVYDPGLVGYGTDPYVNIVHYGDTNRITVYGIGTIAPDHQTPPGVGYSASSGQLKNYATGASTGVTATLTQSGGVVWQPMVGSVAGQNWSGGYDTAVCTDAYNTFHGIVDMTGVVYYGSSGWWVDVTFTGLDPSRTYTFATSASRAKSTTDGAPGYTNRLSVYTISGVDAATNASTPGTTEVSNPYSVYFNTGNNHDEGYVARWTGINPGADGTFKVRATADPSSESGYKAYAFSVFELQSAETSVQLAYPISYDGFSEQKASSDSTSITIPTPGSSGAVAILGSWLTGTTHAKESGANRALIFIAQEESTSGSPTLTSVTYGGQAMTKVIERSAVLSGIGNYVAAFILNESGVAAATSGTFVPTWSATTSSVSYASVFLSNVDQTTSIGASASNGTTSSTNPITTSALSTNNSDMVIDAATNGNNGSYTLGGGFTEGTDQSVGTNGHTGVTGHKSATGANETPSATHSATSARQVIIGFVVQVSVENSGIDGGLLIAAVATDGSTSLTTPAGWTLIDYGNTAGQVTLGAWWKIAGASESSPTFTWTGGQQAYGWMMLFTGQNAANPINASYMDGHTSISPISPAVNTSVGCSMILRLGAFDDSDINILPEPGNPGLSGHTAITMDSSGGSATPVAILGSWLTGTTHAKESGANRALIFIAQEESTSGSPTLTSVTYGGQAMTKVIERSAVLSGIGNYVAAFILNEAGVAAATSGTFVPTWSATTSSVSYASVFLSNVDQTTSIGASASNGTTSSTNPITTSALSTNNGDMVIDAATNGNNGSYTLGGGFTEGTDQSVGTNGHTGVTGHKSATGANETPSATHSATSTRQVIIGLVVQGTGTGTVSGGAGYVKQAAIASSGTSTFALTASQEAMMITIAIAPDSNNGAVCCGGELRP